ncbi:tyrosine-type recombinase/integrase [Brevibacterium sp. p3-SID960]|uniref:tyrosine-type recombinase/integrase n=1 Tax=Brevibacterium sp. p3-SID960 TaxID=2916063 RepID=UPI0021A4B515|nr:site-specific integrase [Brevibacterium sp. p3-SID960]MCT1690069.1 tyrosine-type recombinase/integrase [Brevibacterium sp. p3-SID960]
MATIDLRPMKGGRIRYRVRWYESGRRQTATFESESDARGFKHLIEASGGDRQKATLQFAQTKREGATLTEVAARWISTSRGTEDTKSKYRSLLARHIDPVIGYQPIAELRPADLDEAVQTWAQSGLAAKTVHNIMGVVSPALSMAVRDKLIDMSPAAGIRLPSVPKGDERFLTVSEVKHFVSCFHQHYRDMVTFMAWTGLRYGEMEALRASDIQQVAGDLHVSVNKARVGAGAKRRVGPPKSKAGRRMVSLPAPAATAARNAMGRCASSSDILFPTVEGNYVINSRFRERYWDPAREKAGLPGITPHDLRHTHASWCIQQGLDLLLVQRRLGHESIKTTVDRYGHLRPDYGAVAVSALNTLSRSAPTSLFDQTEPLIS